MIRHAPATAAAARSRKRGLVRTLVVLLTGSSAESAKEVASRIVANVAAEAERYPDAPVGASVGVVHYARSFPAGAGEMLSREDAVMYEAKHGGKGRVAAEVA